MKWHYAQGDQQLGPVSEEEFNNLVLQGSIKPETLVWKEGMADWVPYSTVATPGTAAGETAGAGIVCAECGNQFNFEDVVRFGERYVCASCKPVAIQKMQEGIGLDGAGGGLSPEQLEQTEYDSTAASCIGSGLKTYLGAFFPILGTSFLVFLIMGVFSVIPIAGSLLSLIFSGPLLGGYWHYMVCKTRGDHATVGLAFNGFSSAFGSLFAGYVVPSMLAGVALIPGVITVVIGMGPVFQNGEPMMGTVVVGGVICFIGALVMIYFNICWFFALALITDKRMGFWNAMGLSRSMVRKRWWSNFGILFLFGLMTTIPMAAVVGLGAAAETSGMQMVPELMGIVLIGAVLLGVPWFFCACAHRYNEIYSRLAVQNEI